MPLKSIDSFNRILGIQVKGGMVNLRVERSTGRWGLKVTWEKSLPFLRFLLYMIYNINGGFEDLQFHFRSSGRKSALQHTWRQGVG